MKEKEKYKYHFAFTLLLFWCEKCDEYEWIWNSGDNEILEDVHCVECNNLKKIVPGRYAYPQIPELTPLGIRWFVVESLDLYTKRIKQQVKEMPDNVFKDTDRNTVETSLLNAYTPTTVHLVDPLTLNFEEQIEILLNTD